MIIQSDSDFVINGCRPRRALLDCLNVLVSTLVVVILPWCVQLSLTSDKIVDIARFSTGTSLLLTNIIQVGWSSMGTFFFFVAISFPELKFSFTPCVSSYFGAPLTTLPKKICENHNNLVSKGERSFLLIISRLCIKSILSHQ